MDLENLTSREKLNLLLPQLKKKERPIGYEFIISDDYDLPKFKNNIIINNRKIVSPDISRKGVEEIIAKNSDAEMFNIILAAKNISHLLPTLSEIAVPVMYTIQNGNRQSIIRDLEDLKYQYLCIPLQYIDDYQSEIPRAKEKGIKLVTMIDCGDHDRSTIEHGIDEIKITPQHLRANVIGIKANCMQKRDVRNFMKQLQSHSLDKVYATGMSSPADYIRCFSTRFGGEFTFANNTYSVQHIKDMNLMVNRFLADFNVNKIHPYNFRADYIHTTVKLAEIYDSIIKEEELLKSNQSS